MKRLAIKLIRYFHRPSAARIRAELRRDARRMFLGIVVTQGLKGRA